MTGWELLEDGLFEDAIAKFEEVDWLSRFVTTSQTTFSVGRLRVVRSYRRNVKSRRDMA